MALFPTPGHCQVSVTTQRYDNERTGQNLSETILNTANVNLETFGKLFSRVVDAEVFAQPLIVSKVKVAKTGVRNVLFVATVNNSVYAFDADNPDTAAPLWHANLSPAGARPVNVRDVGQICRDRGDFNTGIVGTPVIDTIRQTLYVVARTRKGGPLIESTTRSLYVVAGRLRRIARTMESDQFVHRLQATLGITPRSGINATTWMLSFLARRLESFAHALESRQFIQQLHALDITTGAERANSPVVIRARVQGTGAGSSNGVLRFDPWIHNQRGALVLANGIVYITWAGHCETGPYHGWIMGYDSKTLAQVFAKVVTPNGERGGIWQSGAGPSSDDSGNLYLTVGNGTVTAPTGGQDYGNAFLKLNPSGEVLDWFVPYNFEALNPIDMDVGSAGVLLIPNTNLLMSGSKEGKLYILDRNNLGHFQSASDGQIVQSIVAGSQHCTPTYWYGPDGPYVYAWGSADRGKAFRLNEGLSTPVSQTTFAAGRRGAILSISAKGASAGTGILWASMALGQTAGGATGILRAFDATDLSHELWNSQQNAARDGLGNIAWFNTPVVANGKLYLATFSRQVVVYGLLSDGKG